MIVACFVVCWCAVAAWQSGGPIYGLYLHAIQFELRGGAASGM